LKPLQDAGVAPKRRVLYASVRMAAGTALKTTQAATRGKLENRGSSSEGMETAGHHGTAVRVGGFLSSKQRAPTGGTGAQGFITQE
jgi:hypothetical protein